MMLSKGNTGEQSRSISPPKEGNRGNLASSNVTESTKKLSERLEQELVIAEGLKEVSPLFLQINSAVSRIL